MRRKKNARDSHATLRSDLNERIAEPAAKWQTRHRRKKRPQCEGQREAGGNCGLQRPVQTAQTEPKAQSSGNHEP